MHAVSTRGLTKRFGGVAAVTDVALEVPVRCVYGFLGLNGAGKTTTIRMLLGLVRPTAGEVHVLGLPMPARRREALARVGAVVEHPTLYPHLTGVENLELKRRLIGAAPSSIDHALEIVEMTAHARRLVGKYSTGMRQRMGIATALLGSPDLLILDEPTNGLDPSGIEGLRRLIRELPDRMDATVFVSSHILSEIEQIADHVGILHEGRLVLQGPLAPMRVGGRSLEQVFFDATRNSTPVIR
jgi:ABC-type multidrug transport system ATPase subunit